jgi:hypothetical protein
MVDGGLASQFTALSLSAHSSFPSTSACVVEGTLACASWLGGWSGGSEQSRPGVHVCASQHANTQTRTSTSLDWPVVGVCTGVLIAVLIALIDGDWIWRLAFQLFSPSRLCEFDPIWAPPVEFDPICQSALRNNCFETSVPPLSPQPTNQPASEGANQPPITNQPVNTPESPRVIPCVQQQVTSNNLFSFVSAIKGAFKIQVKFNLGAR